MKKILKQDSNSRQRQDIVPISNMKERKIKTFLSLPIHLAHHHIAAAAVNPLSLRCRFCRSCCCYCYYSFCLSSVAPVVAPAVAPAVAPFSLRCRFRRSAAAAVTPAVTTLSLLILLLLPLHCHSCFRSVVAPVSLRCFSVISSMLLSCCSAAAAVTPDVAPAIAPAFTPLLSLGFFTAVASRGRIRVTVSIGDF